MSRPEKPDGQRFLELHPLLVLEPGAAPGHRQRGAGHQRRAETGRALAHPAAVVPVVGEVLVVEDGDAASARRQDAADLLHEIAARVELLLLLVPGVVPVLADQQHPVDREGIAPEGQGAGNAVVDGDPVLGGDIPADVGVGKLVDVHRGDLDLRRDQAVVGREALEELADENVGVRAAEILGDDRGDAFAGGQGRRRKLRRPPPGRPAAP